MRINFIFPKSKLEKLVLDFTKNRNGVEIGGPSKRTGRVIYKNASLIDNVIFSENSSLLAFFGQFGAFWATFGGH